MNSTLSHLREREIERERSFEPQVTRRDQIVGKSIMVVLCPITQLKKAILGFEGSESTCGFPREC